MSEDNKFTKTAIEWRRNIVLQKLAKGYSQAEIAKGLQLHPSTISIDVQWLREHAKEELRTHIQERLPFEYARAMAGINDVLRKATELLDSMTDPKMQLQTMGLLAQLYGHLMSMATDGGVIERAMKMVKGLESQDISEVKMSSDKKEDEDEEDFEDEEITVENDEEIINEEEQELREEQ